MNPVHTIGHSNQSVERFVGLLSQHRISAVADVRSTPVSRFAPQFNREALLRVLRRAEISYVFLGKELGARSSDPADYVDGKVQYHRLAESPRFTSGIDRIIDGASRGRLALMCTEQDPLECHRTVLVSPVLAARGVHITHIRSDGQLETHDEAMMRLRQKFNIAQPSLFESEDELVAKALRLQESSIAYFNERVLSQP